MAPPLMPAPAIRVHAGHIPADRASLRFRAWLLARSRSPPTVYNSNVHPSVDTASVPESMRMTKISRTVTVKPAVVVMALVLFVSAVGFVPVADPATAQTPGCAQTTASINGGMLSIVETCSTTGSTADRVLGKPDDHLYCANVFGDYFWGSIPTDATRPEGAPTLAEHRFWLALSVLAGIEYIPGAPDYCGVRPEPSPNSCTIMQTAEVAVNGDHSSFARVPDGTIFADKPWTGVPPHCLYGQHVVNQEHPIGTVWNMVCDPDNPIPVPTFIEYRAVNQVSNALFTTATGNLVRLEGPVLDVLDDCCPKLSEHNHGGPGSPNTPADPCHSHPREPCRTGTPVTFDRINGYGHDSVTIPACPDTATAAVGATFDIVLDYPRRGHGVYATIGGALKPVTFTGTADNFVCRAPSPCGDSATGRRTVPVSVSFELDLEGLNGYSEHRDGNFIEFSETFTAGSGVSWSRLVYSRELVAYFYRATHPDQFVAFNITDVKGTYRYWVIETVTYWIPDSDHPDGAFPVTVPETRTYTAPMTARLVDVDGDPISGDTYYNSATGRIELRIAGFQPVFD